MKKMLLVLILIAGAFFVGRYFDIVKKQFDIIKRRLEKSEFRPNVGLIIVVAGLCLLAGIFIGKGANVVKNVSGNRNIAGFTKGPLAKSSQAFVLCDFESGADLQKWNTIAADIKLSDEFVASGKHSGKFIYAAGVQLSKIAIEKYFHRDKRLGNWEGYSYLLFDVYSTQTNSERVILKIRDDAEKTFQRHIVVPSKRKHTVKIFLSELSASVDISKIRQFNLFRWDAKQEAIFYIDNLRLVTDEGASVAQPQLVDSETQIIPQSMAQEPNIAGIAERRELLYLLKPDLEKWKVKKTNPHPASITRFNAHISNSLEIGRISFPATGGIPFAKGELKTAENVRVVDEGGDPVPFQTKVTARWPDGSIKWLLFDMQVDVNRESEKKVFVEYGNDIKKETTESALKTQQDEKTILLLTGPLKAIMSKKKFDLLGTVYWDMNGDGNFTPDELVLNSGDMYVAAKNKKYFASLDSSPRLEIETEGTEKLSVKRSGWFVANDGDKFCKYIIRIEAFKGKSYVRLYHTFIYTGYPENKFYERYEDLKLPKNETIQEIGILIPQNIKGNTSYAFGTDQGIFSQSLTEDVSLFQPDHTQYAIRPRLRREASNTHDELMKGKHASGWVDLKNEKAGMTAAIRYFWEQYPKEFTINKDNGVLDIKLWPSPAGELDLKTTEKALGPDAVARGNAFGLAKTHELYIYVHEPDIDYKVIGLMAKALTEPLHIRPDPEWLASSTVLGGVREYDPEVFYEAEASLNDIFDWAYRQPKIFNWYGMLDFGDTLSWYRMKGYDKSYDLWDWHPEGRWGWYNCEEMGTHSGALIQYLRTGKQKYLEFGENLSRHLMDVDTCHYNTIANDSRLRGVLDDEVSQVGSMHRHNGDHWGGRNEETTHTNIYGILLYYYLTGYERALEVAKETGSFYLKEPITYTRHPDIAPQRAISNVLWGEMLLYETTQDERYKKAADKWAKLLVEGQNEDGSWSDTYNPLDNAWVGKPAHLYMTGYTIPALIQYHIDTRDEAVGNAIIDATDYLMAHEEYKAYYDALAYSYWITGDDKYRVFLESYLAKFSQHRNRNDDDLHRGMIFDKLIYHRPNEFLHSVPFAFSALSYKPKDISVGKNSTGDEGERKIDPAIKYSMSIVNSLHKVFPDSYRFAESKGAIDISLAKNEYESVQVVLHNANKQLKDVVVEATGLQNKSTGERIDRENIECRIVEYVKTRKPDYSVERVGFWPDPISENRAFDLERRSMQPLWITFYAPKDIRAGNYEGKLIITPSNARKQELPINLRVFDFKLPDTPSFKTAFDLYPNRMEVVYQRNYKEEEARYHKRIDDLVGKYYSAMLKFKISPILNLDYPNPYFDKKVQKYIDDGMSAFAVGRYGGSFDNEWPKDKIGLEAMVGYYRNIAGHLKEKGWIDEAYVYTYDEPAYGDENVTRIASAIHAADPQLRNLVCLQEMADPRQYTDWVKDIDIFTIRNLEFDYDNAKYYKEMGKELWLYVSGPRPPFPNLAIDFPAMAYRILPWMSWKYDVSGLLYWCVNFYNGDPWKNPMNTKWQQNGNGFLFYPGEDGPVPSLRLYVLRDGIEDYEYFKLLSEKLKDAKDKELIDKAKALLEIDSSIVGSMALYTKNPWKILRRRQEIAEAIEELGRASSEHSSMQVVEDFSKPITAANSKMFGDKGQLTFELYRDGTFIIDGGSGFAWQKSDSYRDAAIIRSTNPLPGTYKISAIVGGIDYDLSVIEGLPQDTEYAEGPQNENGCYLLAITDEAPLGHHTNDWWHEHRKVCIDVDNNVWGSGMPNPVFMVYFDKANKLMAFNGEKSQWEPRWDKAVTYNQSKWYKIEIEKTRREFIMSIYDEVGNLLRRGRVDLKDIWHEDGRHPDYLVIGDPHENYYQGSMKIKSITMSVER